MVIFTLFTFVALVSLAMGTPVRDIILKTDTSCQVPGGWEVADLSCRNTVFCSLGVVGRMRLIYCV
jgi:hypothetical protein